MLYPCGGLARRGSHGCDEADLRLLRFPLREQCRLRGNGGGSRDCNRVRGLWCCLWRRWRRFDEGSRQATLASGGQFTAVIPREFLRTETTPRGTILHAVDSLHARKALMMRLSQAFIALPGGFGTIDEFREVLSWRHFQIHSQPIGLLNYRGYYDALLKLFDRMVRQGFVDDYSRGTIVDAPTIHELLASMFEQRRLGQCLEPVKWDESASRGDRSAPG